jgi:hypothetical protein
MHGSSDRAAFGSVELGTLQAGAVVKLPRLDSNQ